MRSPGRGVVEDRGRPVSRRRGDPKQPRTRDERSGRDTRSPRLPRRPRSKPGTPAVQGRAEVPELSGHGRWQRRLRRVPSGDAQVWRGGRLSARHRDRSSARRLGVGAEADALPECPATEGPLVLQADDPRFASRAATMLRMGEVEVASWIVLESEQGTPCGRRWENGRDLVSPRRGADGPSAAADRRLHDGHARSTGRIRERQAPDGGRGGHTRREVAHVSGVDRHDHGPQSARGFCPPCRREARHNRHRGRDRRSPGRPGWRCGPG